MAYVEVSLEDMEKFLKRGWRALRPKQAIEGFSQKEYAYNLSLSDTVAIKVWTSIRPATGAAKGVGEDAIRVQFVNRRNGRPLLKGKSPIVKRTNSWKNTLQTKIEDYIELYEERQGYWDAVTSGRPAPHEAPPPAAKQQEDDSYLDDDEGNAYRRQQEMGLVPREDEEEAPAPPPPSNKVFEGTWTKTNRGDWAARIQGRGEAGARAILKRQDGRKSPVTLIEKVWGGTSGPGYVEIWTIQNARQASEDDGGDDPHYSYDRNDG